MTYTFSSKAQGKLYETERIDMSLKAQCLETERNIKETKMVTNESEDYR